MQTQTYIMAVQSIRDAVDARQAGLDAAAAAARTSSLETIRDGLMIGIELGSPAHAIAALVSQTISVGRDDGYPSVKIPESVGKVIVAAIRAGVVTGVIGEIGFYIEGGGIRGLFKSSDKAWNADYAAWDAARTFRAAQTVQSL